MSTEIKSSTQPGFLMFFPTFYRLPWPFFMLNVFLTLSPPYQKACVRLLSVYWHKLTSHCTSFPAFNPHQYPTVCIKVPIIPNHDATCIPLSHLFPTFCESVHTMMDGYASHYTLFKLIPSPLFCLFPIFFHIMMQGIRPPTPGLTLLRRSISLPILSIS